MSDGSSAKDITFSIKNLTASLHTNQRWIDKLFDDYRLFPVVGDDEKTKLMLSSERLSKALLKIVLRQPILSNIVNSLTGLSLLSQSKDGNLIQVAYSKIDENFELKKTINDRIRKAYFDTAKAGLAFSSVKEKTSIMRAPFKGISYLRALFDKINSVDRKFVSVHGVLCRIDCAQQVLGANIEGPFRQPDRLGFNRLPIFCDGPPRIS